MRRFLLKSALFGVDPILGIKNLLEDSKRVGNAERMRFELTVGV